MMPCIGAVLFSLLVLISTFRDVIKDCNSNAVQVNKGQEIWVDASMEKNLPIFHNPVLASMAGTEDTFLTLFMYFAEFFRDVK